MSRSLVQPVGQKRLTNVAVVRLKKHGKRFEIACYKNKVLSWRARVEKDIDEVLQTHTVYVNVSKGVLAKSKELMEAFGTTDEEKICLEILEKGELQVAGKEREVQLSSQFRDIATIIVDKTLNPETERPYTISMIERFMREIHFAVDPHRSSKKQALELIKELQKKFPITRALMRLKLTISTRHRDRLTEALTSWQARLETQETVEDTYIVVCRIEPGHFRECDALVRECSGKVEVIAMTVHKEDDDDYQEETTAIHSQNKQETSGVDEVSSKLKETEIKPQNDASSSGKRCLTCNAIVGDAKEFREHYKSDWHKHNLKRKVRQLPPLSAEECLVDTAVNDRKDDLDDYWR